MVKTTTGTDIKKMVINEVAAVAQEKGVLLEVALKNSKRTETLNSIILERKERVLKPVVLTVNDDYAAGYFDNTDKSVAVVSGATALRVGDVIKFQTPDRGSKSSLRVIVTALVSDTEFKAQKIGGADVAVAKNDLSVVATYAQEEGKKGFEARGITVPRTIKNVCQIIPFAGEISGTLAKQNGYDFVDAKKAVIEEAKLDLYRKLNGMLSSPVYLYSDINGVETRVAGGLSYFIENDFDTAGGTTPVPTTGSRIKDLGGADVTLEDINDAFQYVIEQEGSVNALRVSPAQARKISMFENSKINIVMSEVSNAEKVGGSTQVLKSPIKLGKGMQIDAIYVDTSLEKDRIEIFDDRKFKVEFFRVEADKITTPTGQDDNYRFTGIVEATCYYENAAENTYLITNAKID